MIVDWLLPLEAMIGDEALTVDCAAETVLAVTLKSDEAAPLSMLRPANVATPFVAATVVVPDSVPPPGFAPSVTTTFAVKPGSVLPSASCAVTCTAGVMAAPAAVLLGCAVNTSCVAAPATTLKAVLTFVAIPFVAAASV